MRIGGRLGRNLVHGSAQAAKEDLGLIGRQPTRVLDGSVEQAVGKLGEIVGFPIVACTRGQQRVERLLPADERMRSDDVGDRVAEVAKGFERAFAVFHVAGVEGGQDHHLFAMHFGREEGHGRRLSQYDPDIEILRQIGRKLSIVANDVRGRRLGMDDESGEHLWPDFVQVEFERGHDPEISSSTSDPPEEIGVLVVAGGQESAVGRHDFGGA